MPAPIPVEARSLAALNDLASNPPQYPRNPAQGRQEPLTLYISRVPGTKDVILSTFRPGLKNVTAEDIASSLYYVHFELLAPFAASPPRQRQQQQQQPSIDIDDAQCPNANANATGNPPPRPSFEFSRSAAVAPKPIRRKPLPPNSPISPIAPESSSPAQRLQIPPSPSPSAQLDVHPLLRTPVQEQPPTHLSPSQSLSPMSRAPCEGQGVSPTGYPPKKGQGGYLNGNPSPSRFNDNNAPHLQNHQRDGPLAPHDAGELAYRAYSPLNSIPSSPQPGAGASPAMLSNTSPILRNPSPPRSAPTRTLSTASQHPALPSSRRALVLSMPASSSTDPAVFQALDEHDPAPPLPLRHPRRLSQHNILGGRSGMPADRPATPTRAPAQSSAMLPPPPPYSPPRTSAYPVAAAQETRPSSSMDSPGFARSQSGLTLGNSGATVNSRPSLDNRAGLLTPPPSSTIDRVSSPNRALYPPPTGPGFFTLTLIRREPSSGNQWNVGRITALGPSRPPESDHDHQDTSSLLHIYVNTLGYSKFANPIQYRQYAGMDPRQAMSTAAQGSSSPPPNGPAPTHPQPQQATPRIDGPPVFQREVHASYGKRWTSNLKDLFRRSHHGTLGPGMHARRRSDDSTGSFDHHDHDYGHDDGHAHGSHRHDTKLRGYDFESPWGGRCEFRTAEGGRNLRCQHHVPLEGVVAPIPGHHHGPPQLSARDPVSELRFHLPRPSHHARSQSSSDVPAEQQAVHGHFSRLMWRGGGGDDEDAEWDDDDDGAAGLGVVSPFELNLGREKAGGGHRGKRAKMGKLIVHDAGLRMLDLVVAANVGLWWRLWDVQG